MDFELTPDQELLRETVRRFLAEQAPIGYVRARYDAPSVGHDRVWDGLCALGVLGLGMCDSLPVLEELGRALCPAPYASSSVGAAPLARGELARRLTAGEAIGTVALHEPGRRYEWRSPATRAVPGTDTGWRLTGVKVHVPDGAGADVLLVTATDPDGVLGLFAVERGAAGVAAVPTPTVDGSRKHARVELRDAPAARIGADATDAVARAVDRLAVAAVVDAVGAAGRALEMTVEHAKQRVQFGRPIGSFQAVQHLCADMLRAVELARAAAYYACWALDEADAAEAHRAATIAKAFASESLTRVGADAIQVFGGIGFTWEHDVHLFYKRLLTCSAALGGAGEHLAELARIAIG
ncbi:MAG: acyl-CoA dehydrogenase [Acidimicrobiia bacterium]|nr:MAG: acyl-CoA dehydrogenase [Acidimicrobiia bacterium]